MQIVGVLVGEERMCRNASAMAVSSALLCTEVEGVGWGSDNGAQELCVGVGC